MRLHEGTHKAQPFPLPANAVMAGKRRDIDAFASTALPSPCLPSLTSALLALGMLSAALTVDPWAAEPFVSPKWLMVELCVAGALGAAVLEGGIRRWRQVPRLPTVVAALGGFLVFTLIAASLAADSPTAAVPTLRRALLLAALPLLAAHPGMGEALRHRLLPAALVGLLINGALSLLQWSGINPLPLAQPGGRFPTGALLGNEGLLALSAALLLPVLAVLLGTRLRGAPPAAARSRLVGLAIVVVLALLVIAVNRQLTAGIAAAAGLATIALLALRWLRLLQIGLWSGLLVVVLLIVPQTRALLSVALPDAEQVQTMTTQRLGAWAAADGMWRSRPWLGHGPGSYTRKGQDSRLAAEQQLGVRLSPPVTATGFAEAHNDYLQLAAEGGLPALLAALLGSSLMLHGLLRRAREDLEARALAGLLVAGAVAALAWFPLQVPLLAMLLMLALGRAWRLIAEPHG